jgi:2'-5' RNA ligase
MRLYAVAAPPVHEVNRLLASVRSQADPCLDWGLPAAVQVGLAFFGNLVLTDLQKLTGLLAAEVAQAEPLSLRFAGGSALEEEGDDSVWVTVEGDTHELRTLAMAIAAAAGREGFTVDRRWYKPHARVARVNAATTVPSLQGTLDRLTAYEGPSWSLTEVTLVEVKASTGLAEAGAMSVLDYLPLRA